LSTIKGSLPRNQNAKNTGGLFMKKLFMFFCRALIALPLFGCKEIFNFESDDDDRMSDKQLVGVEWHLQAFEDPGVTKTDIGSQGILLFFKADSTFKGRRSYTIKGDLSVPGNSYGGVYKAGADDSLYLSRPWTTKVGTPPGSRYVEYLDALENASSFKIEGNGLRIFYNDKMKAIEFEAQ
jgi:hypothetical protein